MKLLLLLILVSCGSKEVSKNCDNGTIAPECKICPEGQVMGKDRCVFSNTGTSVDEKKWAPLKQL
jgi:hypothetical protein